MEALLAMLGATVSMLAVMVGTIIRATRAFTKVEVAASSASQQLSEYIKDDRVTLTAYQVSQEAKLQALGLRMSTMELELARRDGRDAANRSA